jgi:hypothetical protein
MQPRRCLLALLCLATLRAADALPADIDKASLSRLPLLTRADMKDDYERKVWDMVYGDRKTPLLGPGGVSLYSPKLAESMHLFLSRRAKWTRPTSGIRTKTLPA